jgi:hypothetical protein
VRELSLHILDIVQNSISADATIVEIEIEENLRQDELKIIVCDNGKGMSEEMVAQVVDPFFTTRTTRKVGLGIPLFKASAEACDGSFELCSKLGLGTTLKATFRHSHIDRVPLGSMAETIMTCVMSNPTGDLYYKHQINNKFFVFSTLDIRKVLGEDVPLDDLDVLRWITSFVDEGLEGLKNDKES